MATTAPSTICPKTMKLWWDWEKWATSWINPAAPSLPRTVCMECRCGLRAVMKAEHLSHWVSVMHSSWHRAAGWVPGGWQAVGVQPCQRGVRQDGVLSLQMSLHSSRGPGDHQTLLCFSQRPADVMKAASRFFPLYRWSTTSSTGIASTWD